MDEERIKEVVHHSGNFVSDDNGKLKFEGERAEWSCHPDLLSYFGIVASVKELGHMDIKELWYGLGGQSVHPDRLEFLTDDRGAMHMLNIARLNDEVHLYVVHNMMEPEIIEMIDWVGGQVDDEGDVARQVEEVEVEVVRDGQLGTEMVEGEGDTHEGDVEVHTEVGTKMVEGEGDAQDGDGLDHTAVGRKMVEGEDDAHEGEGDGYEGDGEDHSDAGTKRVEGEGEGDGEDHSDGGTKMVEGEGKGDGQDHSDAHEDVEIHHVEEAEVHDVDDFELEDYGEDDDVEDSEGDAHQAETEDEDVDRSEGSLIDVSVHCDIGTFKGNVGEQASSALLESERSTENEFIDDMCKLSDNEWLSEELFSGSDSEDNHVRTKIRFPAFKYLLAIPPRPPTVEVPTAQSVQVTQPPAAHVPISHQTTMPLSDE
ncbi:hypothetical protein LR48_Vigan04g170300 [Vigna angularis]|uniref:PB1-like domain-containing protein n=1 Tax=Phaseolus angularis TaxID=3914 RepID=A0A0L9UF45_PHAAN|nr:hypothetical protein LR48_Vigan04g170300 [Vigna angularis]